MNIIPMSIAAAVLILAIVIIRSLAIHRLPKKTFLVLWCVVLVRLLIPFYVPLPPGVYSFTDRVMAMVSSRTEAEMYTAVNPPVTDAEQSVPTIPSVEHGFNYVPAITPETSAQTFLQTLTAIWLLGMIGLALFFIATHLRGRKEYVNAE